MADFYASLSGCLSSWELPTALFGTTVATLKSMNELAAAISQYGFSADISELVGNGGLAADFLPLAAYGSIGFCMGALVGCCLTAGITADQFASVGIDPSDYA